LSERINIPEFDDAEVREHILRIRGLIAEETIETLKMVRLDHIVNPRGKLQEYDQQTFRAWVIAWLNALETVLCAHMAMMTKRLSTGGLDNIQGLVVQPEKLLEQVEDIKRALEIILTAESEMTPERADKTATGEFPVKK
jgi:hypothetical protein